MTQPRCAGQKCYKRDGCKRYAEKGNGWIDQYRPFMCKAFIPLLEQSPREKLLSLSKSA